MKKNKMILILLVAITIVVATSSKPSQAGIIVTINTGWPSAGRDEYIGPGGSTTIVGNGIKKLEWSGTINCTGFDVVSNVAIDEAWSNFFYNDCGGGDCGQQVIFDDPSYTIGDGFEFYIEVSDFVIAPSGFGIAPSGFGIETSGSGIETSGVGLEITFTAVPEPTTLCLLGLGGLALRRKRRAC